MIRLRLRVTLELGRPAPALPGGGVDSLDALVERADGHRPIGFVPALDGPDTARFTTAAASRPSPARELAANLPGKAPHA